MLNKRLISILMVILLTVAPSAFAESEEYLLAADVNLSGNLRTVAEVLLPEEYVYMESTPLGNEPEYYFFSSDPDSPVRFFYYTTGYGKARNMAENAAGNYVSFYTDCEVGEIFETEFNGNSFLGFTYIAGYPNEDNSATVWEQSTVCYCPINDSAFVACIVSLDFDSREECLDAEALEDYLRTACEAIAFVE